MKKMISILSTRLFVILFFGLLLLVIAGGNKRQTNIVYNVNGTKSLEAMHIVTKYDATAIKVLPVSNMLEVAQFGPSNPVSFVGQMTAYGPDCVGCGGTVSCPPRPDVTKNITFEDTQYGTVRILAADPAIPCGSIIQIDNVTFSNEPILGIVLDRGGAIRGNIIDYLIESEKYTGSTVGRQKNVQFQIIRWGW